MRPLLFTLLGLALFSAPTGAATATTAPAPGTAGIKPGAPTEPVWEAHLAAFDEPTYERQVEKMIATFEQATGKKLVPGPKKKVGLPAPS